MNTEERLTKLERDLQDLIDEVYTNNFTAHRDFNKTVHFNVRLKVPHYASTPSTAETGELCEVGGILYIASATNVWTKVGVQV